MGSAVIGRDDWADHLLAELGRWWSRRKAWPRCGRPRRAHSGRPPRLPRLGAGHRRRPRRARPSPTLAGARRAPHRRRPPPAAAHLAAGARQTGEVVQLLDFAAGGAPCRGPAGRLGARGNARAVPGRRAAPRALRRRARRSRAEPARLPTAARLDDALADRAAAWAREPVGLAGAAVLADAALLPLPDGVRPQVVDADRRGRAPARGRRPVGSLLALTGGRPTMLFGELERSGFRVLSVRADRRAGGGVSADFGTWWTDLTAAALVGTAPAAGAASACRAGRRAADGAAREVALLDACSARRARRGAPECRARDAADRRAAAPDDHRTVAAPAGGAAARAVAAPAARRRRADAGLVRVWLDAAEAHGHRRHITCCPTLLDLATRDEPLRPGGARRGGRAGPGWPRRTRRGAGPAERAGARDRQRCRSGRCRDLGTAPHRRACSAGARSCGAPTRRPRASWSSPPGRPIGGDRARAPRRARASGSGPTTSRSSSWRSTTGRPRCARSRSTCSTRCPPRPGRAGWPPGCARCCATGLLPRRSRSTLPDDPDPAARARRAGPPRRVGSARGWWLEQLAPAPRSRSGPTTPGPTPRSACAGHGPTPGPASCVAVAGPARPPMGGRARARLATLRLLGPAARRDARGGRPGPLAPATDRVTGSGPLSRRCPALVARLQSRGLARLAAEIASTMLISQLAARSRPDLDAVDPPGASTSGGRPRPAPTTRPRAASSSTTSLDRSITEAFR